jgi:hypothetical protein
VIRDHGDAVEADLAFRGIDFRDLYRRGSGMTLRRMGVLLRGLPPDALLWHSMNAAEVQTQKPTPEQIRARQAHYDQQRGGA